MKNLKSNKRKMNECEKSRQKQIFIADEKKVFKKKKNLIREVFIREVKF
jgi:hypothetical protein